MITWVLCAMYLTAIVLANMTVTAFGVYAVIPVALVLIGLDLTARDKLHDLWKHRQLAIKMGALIAAGSVLSYILNSNSYWIGIASLIAFCAAAVVDTLAYHILQNQPRWLKINVSNVFSAFVDSLLFPTIAFGAVIPLVILGQFAAKVVGGFIWWKLLDR